MEKCTHSPQKFGNLGNSEPLKNQKSLIGIGILVLIGLLEWAIWITDDYAKNKVIEREGFPNTVVGL